MYSHATCTHKGGGYSLVCGEKRGEMALSLFLLVSLAVIACAQEGDEGDPGDVIVLDQSNFAEGVNKDLVLVEFYAPW